MFNACAGWLMLVGDLVKQLCPGLWVSLRVQVVNNPIHPQKLHYNRNPYTSIRNPKPLALSLNPLGCGLES